MCIEILIVAIVLICLGIVVGNLFPISKSEKEPPLYYIVKGTDTLILKADAPISDVETCELRDCFGRWYFSGGSLILPAGMSIAWVIHNIDKDEA